MMLYGMCTICKIREATILMENMSGHCFSCNLKYNEEQDRELHPAGTRDELEALRERCAALEAELDDMRAHFVAANGEKRIWRGLNRLHIAQRDLALAETETWKRSRDEWKAHCERAESAATTPVNDD